jgi:hypothetical protein
MKTPFSLLPALVCAGFIVTIQAAEVDPRRAEAEMLMEKAREAKRQGHPDEAEMLWQRAKKIESQIGAKGGEKTFDKNPGVKDRNEGETKLERVKRQIEELHRAGKHEEAAELERRMAEAQNRPMKDPRPEGADRIDHILQAAKHLHMAGLEEEAVNLEHVAAQLRAEEQHRAEFGGAHDGDRKEEEIRATQQETEQLRRQMEKLQRQVEELREQSEKRKRDAAAQQ